jgi:hypothetical protein
MNNLSGKIQRVHSSLVLVLRYVSQFTKRNITTPVKKFLIRQKLEQNAVNCHITGSIADPDSGFGIRCLFDPGSQTYLLRA